MKRVRLTLNTRGLVIASALVALAAPWPSVAQPRGGPSPDGAVPSGAPLDPAEGTPSPETLGHKLSRKDIEDLRRQLGVSLASAQLNIEDFEGRPVSDLYARFPDLPRQHPQVAWALDRKAGASAPAQDGGSTAPHGEPGRIVPVEDVVRNAWGPDGGRDRLDDYLETNFRLSPEQRLAYGIYLGVARAMGDADDAGATTAADGSRPTGTSPDHGAVPAAERPASGRREPAAGARPGGASLPADLEDLLDAPGKGLDGITRADAGGAPIDPEMRGGLYLPSADVLGKIAGLAALWGSFRKAGDGADPSTLRGPDGRTLAEVIADLEPDPARRKDPSEVGRMTLSEVRREITRLIARVVEADREANAPLFESGLAWTRRPTAERMQKLRGRRSRARVFPVTGNGKLREMNLLFYERMIKTNLRPSERDALELDSGGDIFSIRGRPVDTRQKHYDPVIDPEGLVFGTGMNLDGTPYER